MIAGAFLLLPSVFLSGFPRELPGARERREKLIKRGILPSKDQNITENLKDIIPSTWQLLKNPVFIFSALALTASTFAAVGIAPFIVKFLYLRFNLNAAMAGLALGIALIPGCGGNI